MVIAQCIKVYRDSSGRITGYKLKDENGSIKNVLAKDVEKAISSGKLQIINEISEKAINESDEQRISNNYIANSIKNVCINNNTETDNSEISKSNRDNKIEQYLLDIRTLSYDVSSIDIKYGGNLFEDNYSECKNVDTWYTCKIFNGKLDGLLKSNGIVYLQKLHICIDAILKNMSIEQVSSNTVVFFIKGKEFIIGTSIEDITKQLKLEETYMSLKGLCRFLIEQKKYSNGLNDEIIQKVGRYIKRYDPNAYIEIYEQNKCATVIINNIEVGCCFYIDDNSASLVKDDIIKCLDSILKNETTYDLSIIDEAIDFNKLLNTIDKKFMLEINRINQELLSRLAI